MKRPYKHMVAFDCGNSSVRVVSGLFDGQRIELNLVRQVEHSEIELNGIYYWDALFIFSELQKGLREAYEQYGEIESCGICTWGIDFGILGAHGQLLGNPLCYRNGMGEHVLERLDKHQKRQAFFDTGIQNHPMNTLYQLVAYREAFPAQYAAVDKLLLLPDLLAFFFTGKLSAERTIASTTQYYDVQSRDYSKEALERYGIERRIFTDFVEHGEVIGRLRPEIAARLNVNSFPFICVPSHDTACAVAAVPADEDFLFVSSGTWGLIGIELDAPQVDERVYETGLTNEEGAYGSITLLKNGPGMYIAQQIRSELRAHGKDYSWDELVELSRNASEPELVFNVEDLSLLTPKPKIEAVRGLLRSTGQNGDCDIGSLMRAFYNSVALTYRKVVEDIEEAVGRKYGCMHIVGGGSQNAFLNQMAANAIGKTVVAGPAEATSLGNIIVQIAGKGNGSEALPNLRQIARASVVTKNYQPQENYDKLYSRYLNIQK